MTVGDIRCLKTSVTKNPTALRLRTLSTSQIHVTDLVLSPDRRTIDVRLEQIPEKFLNSIRRLRAETTP